MKTQYNLLVLILFINLSNFAQKSAPVDGYLDGGLNCRHASSVSCNTGTKNSANTYLYLDDNSKLIWEIHYNHLSKEKLKVVLNEPFSKSKNVYIYAIEEDFILDLGLRQRLNLAKNIGRVPRGKYLAIVIGDIIKIKMPLIEINKEQSTDTLKK